MIDISANCINRSQAALNQAPKSKTAGSFLDSFLPEVNVINLKSILFIFKALC